MFYIVPNGHGCYMLSKLLHGQLGGLYTRGWIWRCAALLISESLAISHLCVAQE